MRLNTIKPAFGSKFKRKRVGRGIGCTKGKTCGRGHKGQHSRSGGYCKQGFEGGQMPLQRRVPKSGFISRKARVSSEIRLNELEKLNVNVIDLDILKKTGLVKRHILKAKIIASGKIKKLLTIVGAGVVLSKGARKAIESCGGKIDEISEK